MVDRFEALCVLAFEKQNLFWFDQMSVGSCALLEYILAYVYSVLFLSADLFAHYD